MCRPLRPAQVARAASVSVAGVVRGRDGQKTTGVRMIPGARVDLTDGRALLLYPTDRPAWSRLTWLLSRGKARGGKASASSIGRMSLIMPRGWSRSCCRTSPTRSLAAICWNWRRCSARALIARCRCAAAPTSLRDSTPKPGGRHLAVRLGFRQVRGLANVHGAAIAAARGDAAYESVEEVWRRAGVPRAAIKRLAEADAFHCIAEDRRQGLWKVKGLGEAPLPLFAAADAREGGFSPEGLEPRVTLQPLTDGREVVEDYRSLQLSLRAHPLSFLREQLAAEKVVRCGDLASIRDGRHVEVAGVILVRQRPGSARGVLFITIEDKTGVANGIL
jgi:DNA polymerase III alpha subunit